MSRLERVLQKLQWRKVQAPKPWRPDEPGEELIGFYGGRTLRSGRFGQYEVVILHVPKKGSFTISGTRIIQLADAACVGRGDPVKVVWKGTIEIGDDHTMKEFEMFVVDGHPLTSDEIEEVQRCHA